MRKLFVLVALAASAGNAQADPILDAMSEVDRSSIAGVAILAMCKNTLKVEEPALWFIHRDFVKSAISEIMATPERALIRFDDLYISMEGDAPIAQVDVCISTIDDNRHDTSVAIARLVEARRLDPD